MRRFWNIERDLFMKRKVKSLFIVMMTALLLSDQITLASEELSGGNADVFPIDEETFLEDSIEMESTDAEDALWSEETLSSEELSDGDIIAEKTEVLAGPVSGGDLEYVRAGDSETDNRNGQNYDWNWANPVYSYLVKEATGYMRVEYTGSAVKIQYFDRSYKLLSEGTVTRELTKFGGFYEGSDSYYLAFGQNNPNEDNNLEVIRIVRYDKNWNRLGHASLKGANTTVPFDAGSLRMVEYGGYLYVHTCHEMYMTSDGYNHQANLLFQVRESDMSIVDAQYSVYNISIGYVSHSFNQYILVDDSGYLMTLDHGDAHPRAAVICRYGTPAGQGSFVSYVTAVPAMYYYGETGANRTNATIGGFEYSSTSYLVAGTSDMQDGSNGPRNVYVSNTARSTFGSASTKLIFYSDTAKSGTTVSNPHLVKLASDSFLLLWSEGEMVRYIFLDDQGYPASDLYQSKGLLSDCKPVAEDGGVIWYVTDGNKLTFYRVAADGTFSSEVGHLHSYDADMRFEKTGWQAALTDGTVENKLICNGDGAITYSSSDPSVADVDSVGKVTLKNYGTCVITASMEAGVHYAAKQVSYTLNVVKKTQITGVYNSANGGDIRWKKVPGAEGYVLYRKRSAEGTVKVATIRSADTVQYYDTSIKENCWGRVYHYFVKVLSGGKEGPASNQAVLQRLAPMTITKAVNVPYYSAALQWKCTASQNKALGYELQFAESKEDLFAMRNVTKVLIEGRNQLKAELYWLEKGKTYYFRLRSYINYTNSVTGTQTKTWSQYSNVKTVTIIK